MTHVTLDRSARMLTLVWDDGRHDRFPFLWLCDSDPAGMHPDTHERVFDLLSVPSDYAPEAAHIDGADLCLIWPGDPAPRRLPLDWLRAHAPGRSLPDAAAIPPVAWRSGAGAAAIPRAKAGEILHSDAALARWMADTKAHGLSIVEGMGEAAEAGMEVARRAGFLRQTNFGTIFEVKSKPNPNNLAYTADALPLHTDLPNQDLPPGYQFLHCLLNAAAGGGSVFADGVALAEALRTAEPSHFEQLTDIAIPFRFQDEGNDIRARKPVIRCAPDGHVTEICWNAHIAAIFDLPPDDMVAYYDAYRAFMALTRDPAHQVTVKLGAGEMAVFDNRRVLHGRAAFDPASGARHLRGCYVDRGEWDSRLRVLARGSGALGHAAE